LFTPSEDFWSRQTNRQSHSLIQVPFGMPLGITANNLEALDAARLSAGRFSSWGEPGSARAQIRMVVRSQPTAPLPVDLPERLVYSGVKEWITVSAGEWGHGFANLATREAYLFLSPALAAEARLVSRYFIDHYILNFLLTEWAMLHASCVGKEGRLLVLVAPHNVGKSTTALRLLNAGYNFLADGMALLKRRPSFERERLNNIDNGRELVVGGYPIGEVKLRDDVLALFPKYAGEAVQVREQRKTVVDLRATHPGQVVKSILRPSVIHVCLVERTSDPASQLTPLSPAEAAPTLAANTVFWDEPERLAHNAALLDRLMQTACFHRLSIGTDTHSLVDTLEKLS
jgi:hypothetical protein